MLLIDVELKPGSQAQAWVDPFYLAHDSAHRAREQDLFFLAFAKLDRAERKLLGCVRFCVEENTPLLRSMMVHKDFRKSGVGTTLLSAFQRYLQENKIQNTYCLPYSHLVNFYGCIGFETVPEYLMPEFLKKRIQAYTQNTQKSYLCMRRP